MEPVEMKQIQNHNETKFNRYPWAWSKIPITPSKILSFGCSTGEEAVTAKGYFMDAEIHGFDTNKVVLNIARLRFPFITFLDSISDNRYDLILCNSVLCNHPANFDKKENDLMNFKLFEGMVYVIDTMLNPGGVLMAMNTEYRIQDAIGYKPIGSEVKFTVNLFDSKGKKTTPKNYALWRKI
jgi:chemotaxis methyl-accepting protein methylase